MHFAKTLLFINVQIDLVHKNNISPISAIFATNMRESARFLFKIVYTVYKQTKSILYSFELFCKSLFNYILVYGFIVQITNKKLTFHLNSKLLFLYKVKVKTDNYVCVGSLKEDIKTSSFRQKSLEKCDVEIDDTLRTKVARFLLT